MKRKYADNQFLCAIYALGGGSTESISKQLVAHKATPLSSIELRLESLKDSGLADWRIEEGKKAWFLTMAGIEVVEKL